ncbi:glycosyltransferase family 4 protein [Tundrisphaera lichenicola]|uniref:glycosyltransferase family 4 protein n=1 Tax=Tundrisphaera lichenicola TaxID=2029860 RepID=UPI003EBDCC4E
MSYFHPAESGAERQALAQGLELTRRGHRVHVVTRFIPGLPVDETVGGILVHRWIRPIAIGPLFGLSFVASLIGALRRLRPEYDLIHTHQALWEAISVGLARSLLGDVPTLIQPASSGYFGEASELLRTRGALILRRAALRNRAFAAISADIEREWLGLGVPPDQIIRTASGVDAHHFRPGPVAPEVEDSLPARPRVVFTGRLHPQKNLGLLLEAWPAVARQSGASLILVGQGPERESLARRMESLGLSNRVHFVGAVADPAEYLRAADIFVLPSVAEGMSNSLLEAMATGLPCLASEIGGNIDLLGPGDAGLLLPPDPGIWAASIVRVLNDHELARRLGASALHRVEEEFSLEAVVTRYEQIYLQLLNKRPNAGVGLLAE